MKSFLLTATLLGSTSAFSQPTKQSLDQLHQNYAKALVSKDFIAIERFYDKHISRDFEWQKLNGPLMTFIDMWEGNRLDLANLTKGVSDGPINFRMKLKTWTLKGNVATVNVHTSGNGEWYKNGAWTPVTFRMVVRETWRYENNKWIAINFRDVSVIGKLGKPQKTSSWRRPHGSRV